MIQINRLAAWLCLGLGLCLGAAPAWARSNGLAATGCDGCHQGGAEPQVTIQRTPLDPAPGEVVTLEVGIEAVNGNEGGMYLSSNGQGAFQLVSGQSTKLLSPGEVVHSSPKLASGGQVSFRVQWTAPSTPGGVDFEVYAVSANGSNSQNGDGAGTARLSFAFGCAGITYFRDFDGDGVGSALSGSTVNCKPPPGYSAAQGDCNENDERVFPGNPETCNGRDDNCDGRTDEGVTVVCGVGMCARQGASCEAGLCTPGAPTAETCNALDDDCDGVVDNDVTCPAGEACFEGECIPSGDAPDAGSSSPDSGRRHETAAAGGCSSTSGAMPLAALVVLLAVRLRRSRVPGFLMAASLLLVAGCSREYESQLLGIRYEPPPSMKFEREEAGPPPVAHFRGGLEIRSIPGTPPPVAEPQLRQTLETLRSTPGLKLQGELVTARAGTLPAGEVARYELSTKGARTLVYVVPAKDRTILLTLTAPDSDYGRLQNQFERSLSTLTLR